MIQYERLEGSLTEKHEYEDAQLQRGHLRIMGQFFLLLNLLSGLLHGRRLFPGNLAVLLTWPYCGTQGASQLTPQHHDLVGTPGVAALTLVAASHSAKLSDHLPLLTI